MLWITVAFAQEGGGFDAHGFRFASADPDLRDPASFLRPGAIEPRQWSIGGLAEYASRPLVFEAAGERTVALSDLVAVNLAASVAPVDKVRLDVSFPVVLTSGGELGAGGPAPGELRASLLVQPLEPEEGGFGLGLLAALDAPTGDPSRYLGTVGPAALVGLTGTGEIDRVTISGLGGARFAPGLRPAERPSPTEGGDTIEGAGSVGVLFGEQAGVGLEGQVSWPIDSVVREAMGVPASIGAFTRYLLDGGGFVSLGVGTGLVRDVAPPVRVVLGGGYGAAGKRRPKDLDADGFEDKIEACPGAAETVNGYRDDDGCPDVLPELQFVAKRVGAGSAEDEPAAALVVTGPDGASQQGLGKISVRGLPGQPWSATAKVGACFGGTASGEIPLDGTAVAVVPIARQDAELIIAVTDGGGRPLDGAVARYLVEDDLCAPAETALSAGKGRHVVGAGPTTVFLTAPGYGVYQATITLQPGEQRLLDPKLAPTQVSLRDGELRFAKPVLFQSGSAFLGESAEGLLGQAASILLSNGELRFRIEAWAPRGGTKKLSQDRAQSVADFLVSVGIPYEQVVAVGRGALPSGQQEYVRITVAPPE